MKLINPDEIKFVIAPIAPMLIGEQVHFERVAFEQDVRQIRKIEAEPVVHAHWIVIDSDSDGDEAFCHCWETLKCSRCGYERETEDGYMPDYCEGCGSKMDLAHELKCFIDVRRNEKHD